MFPFLIGKVLTVAEAEAKELGLPGDMFPFLIGKVLTWFIL